MTKNGRPHCRRCGNHDPNLFASYHCYRCKQECTYCRSCIMMGKITSCSPLVRWLPNKREKRTAASPFTHPSQRHHQSNSELHSNPNHQSNSELIPNRKPDPKCDPSPRHTLAWTGTLSYFQQKASDKLYATINDFLHGKNERNTFLVWAVCGSGKTEMLFHGIESALNAGLHVLIATPRTDVVLELEPRLKAAFPNTKILPLYGGAEDRFGQGDLVISTTHQLLRFHNAFDLVIIDEVDAFPYTADQKLRYAVNKAKRDRSLTVFVTATPDGKMKWQAETGEILSVKVARRYHRHPLPVPRYKWVGQWKKKLAKATLPIPIFHWIQTHLTTQKQIFLFVPSVAVMHDVADILERTLQTTVGFVHSSDPDRREKVMAFRNGKTRVLVTTTILERGVTVKGVQVGVLGSEDRIFTESALVQISGRAGRSPDAPTGDVTFFHYGKTNEMVKAVRHIQEMNRLGDEELALESRKLREHNVKEQNNNPTGVARNLKK
ncbi:DEAD/DEAH box helicase [Bacillus tamaricis]|uniref:DEAD/DEAH box helicase n=2 Tax=Evansella tamaricis TaxID=2069301 RepID=A0ABS6JLP1_9BACI|nr:DEAD/DEAH box helicase [Evansella tamaricis]